MKMMRLIWIILALFIIPHASAEKKYSIEAGNVSLSDDVYIITVRLTGNQDDTIIAKLVDKDGNLKETKRYEAANEVQITIPDALPSDCVHISLVDKNEVEICESVDVKLNVIYASDWQALAKLTTYMVNTYSGKTEGDGTARLIVKTNEALPDISGFNPDLIVMDEDSHYYIQFLKSTDANECAEYLATLPMIEYVEPDGSVTAY